MMVIVDTNVAVVANGKSEQASEECVDTCIGRLEQIIRGETKLVLDENWLILGEYSRNLHSRGADVGDRFLRWVLNNRHGQCELVSITPIENSESEFEEFPSDPALKDFHSKDRKFVAIALAHSEKPPILEALDSGWLNFRDALCQHDVKVEFICEDDIHRLRGGTGVGKVEA